ncbi:MAG: DUF5011 domain-containing protein, partial [Bacilli bacterium]
SAFENNVKLLLKSVEYAKLNDSALDPTTITKENMKETIDMEPEKYAEVTFTVTDEQVSVVAVGAENWDGLTAYGTSADMRVVDTEDYDIAPPVLTLLGDNPTKVAKGSTYIDAGATASDAKDGNITSDIIATGTVDTSEIGTYTRTYTVADHAGNTVSLTRTVNVVGTANAPVLATGMTPIKWDGSAWVTTTADDNEWYNYTETDKKWANAKTSDGSMWVWIPRYIYKMTSGWHTNTAATIEVKFTIETDDTNGGAIEIVNTNNASDSNGTWSNHPAFTFGSTELTGIWVAKFEASGTTSAVNFVPNVTSLRSLTVNNAFTASRNMETNSRYGWDTTGTGVDTHLIKNNEWGAAVYLANSLYGKNDEVIINSSGFYTGGGTSDAYVTNVSQSTTGNVYGIYDMGGGAYEQTAGYVNNSYARTDGSLVVDADAKYKDVYQIGTTDSVADNYALAINHKGDAIYETSSSGGSSTSWYADYSRIPATSNAWVVRSGYYGTGTGAGIFHYSYRPGTVNAYDSFRVTLLVGEGL